MRRPAKSCCRVPQKRRSRICRNSSITPESAAFGAALVCSRSRSRQQRSFIMIRTDSEIKRDVEDELKYDAGVDSTDIGVAIKNGVVSLTGFVRSYGQKLQAEMDTKRVSGVMAVANDLEVRLASADSRPDPEIARDLVTQ